MEKIKKSKSLTIWLIILLCAIILGLTQLVTRVQNQAKNRLLREEIEKLKQKVEEEEKSSLENQEETRKLEEALVASPSATAVATQSAVGRQDE